MREFCVETAFIIDSINFFAETASRNDYKKIFHINRKGSKERIKKEVEVRERKLKHSGKSL